MPLRRPTALFGRLCKKNFIKSCFEPGLPFAGLQTPAKCKGRGAGFNEQKKKLEIILIYAYFAYRIELMTSRMLSRRLQFRCFVRIYQLSYIPKSGSTQIASNSKLYNRKTRFEIEVRASVFLRPSQRLRPSASRRGESPASAAAPGTPREEEPPNSR